MFFWKQFLLFATSLYRSDDYPFRNASLSHGERVEDLLSRLTNDELTQQMMFGGGGPAHGPAPPIPRLNIRPYQWRSECLHGYGFDGNATSFPQVISLAASFHRETLHTVALATAFEARAKYNSYVEKGEYEDHKGINCFSPVVNIMRHPLWGRSQETMGEDPFLTSELADVYVRGLSGFPLPERRQKKQISFDNHVFLTSASCKHFAVHNGPENIPVSRLSFEANVSAADLWLTYLPAFRACLDAGAQSVMCAYSGINGIPSCANKWLLTDVLRHAWNFTGFVISDMGGLQFLVSQHKAFSTYLEAAFMAFKAGVNIENSEIAVRGVYSALPALVWSGAIKRNQLEAMVRPLFLTRLRQAEFDPPELNPYRDLKKEKFIQSPKHRQLSLVAGCRSTVLLKNAKNFLPLIAQDEERPPMKRVALIGPFARRMDELIGSYPATPMPEFEVNLEMGLKDIFETVVTEEFCRSGAICSSGNETALITLLTGTPLPEVLIITVGTGSSLVGEHQDRLSLNLFGAQPRMLELANIHAPSIPVVLLVFSSSPVNLTVAINSTQVRSILWFGYPGQEAGKIVATMLLGKIGTKQYSDDSVLFRFDHPKPTAGNRGYAKETTDDEEKDGYWWTPGGRLPFTWYASLENLPNITVYEMTIQTFRFNQFATCIAQEKHGNNSKTCLSIEFPFGFGLTYNRQPNGGNVFQYRNLDLPTLVVSSRTGFTFTVEVVNRGILACEEVVQVYIDWINLFNTTAENNFENQFKAAFRQLVGFRRVSLFPGTVKKLIFFVSSEQLHVWSYFSRNVSPLCPGNGNITNCGSPVPGSGTIRLSVGGQQPFQEKLVNSNIIVSLISVVNYL